MSASSASQKRSKGRSADLPGFTGRADRLGPARATKRKQPTTEPERQEPRSKKPRSNREKPARTSRTVEEGKADISRARVSNELRVGTDELSSASELVKVEATEIVSAHTIGLTDLPVELILQIHEISGSSELACVNRYISSALKNPTPLHAIRWLMSRYAEQGSDKFLSLALRHPVCELALLRTIEQGWGELAQTHERAEGQSAQPLSAVAQTLRPMFSRNNLTSLPCHNVPRRIFRTTPREPIINKTGFLLDPLSPLGRYVTQRFQPSSKVLSYGVRHAAYTGQHDMAAELILLGGEPFSSGGLALEIAMRRGDLKMVQILVETPIRAHHLGDINQEIKALILKFATREILDYFIKERGVKLSLGSILAL